MKFPYTVSESSITVMVNGAVNQMPKTHMSFEKLSEHLRGGEHDSDYITELFDKRTAVSRLTEGKVKVVGATVYYNGAPVRSALADKLIFMLDSGYDASPWAKFMDRIATNPTERSREMLFDFIERWNSPLTEDGRFIAFKGVRENYTDVHTGTFDNSPGKVVEMDREKVNPDPNQTCSSGLHVCASHYLDSFWRGYKVIAVAVAPEDVVSIPTDYQYSKMRTCRYEVLGDIEDERHRGTVERSELVGKSSEGRVGAQDKPAPTPTETAKGAPVEYGDEVIYDDMVYEVGDGFFDEGDLVINTRDGVIGKVVSVWELDFDDVDHPDYWDWESGDVAGRDIEPVWEHIVEFDDGTTDQFVLPEGAESHYAVLNAIRSAEDSGEYLDDDDYDYDDYLDDDGQDEYDEDYVVEVEQPTVTDMQFEHVPTGATYGASMILNEVEELGQRGFQRKYGVPRTTVQEWLKTIRNQ